MAAFRRRVGEDRVRQMQEMEGARAQQIAAETAELKAQLTTADAKLECERARHDFERDRAVLAGRLKAAQTRVAKLGKQLSTASAAADRTRQQRAGAQDKLRDVEEQRHEAEAALKKALAQRERASDRVRTADAELKDSRNRHDRFTAQRHDVLSEAEVDGVRAHERQPQTASHPLRPCRGPGPAALQGGLWGTVGGPHGLEHLRFEHGHGGRGGRGRGRGGDPLGLQ